MRHDRLPVRDRLPRLIGTPRGGERTAARRWRLAAGARVAVAALVVCAAAATAAAPAAMAYGTALSCSGRSVAQYYRSWGDTNGYFRITNGGFESGPADWQLNGQATVVAGNERFRVAGASDSRALRLQSGASAESRTLCVSTGEDKVRLFAYNPGVRGAILHVDVVVRNSKTGVYGYFAWDLNADAWPGGWQPTPTLAIPNVYGGGSTEELTITLSTRGSGATWYVDDVCVDPFKSY
jgi:hypothetical protein